MARPPPLAQGRLLLRRKEKHRAGGALWGQSKSVGEVGGDQLNQSVYRLFLVRTDGEQVDGRALGDAKGQDAEQALRIYAALFLLNKNGALELVRPLNEKRCRSCVQTYLVGYLNFLGIHYLIAPYSSDS